MKKGDQTKYTKKLFMAALLPTLLTIAIWSRFHGTVLSEGQGLRIVHILFELFLYGGIAYTLSNLIRCWIKEKKSLDHFAFLTTSGISILLMVITMVLNPGYWQWGYLILSVFGSFWGSFIAAAQTTGWWENNAPPSQKIEADVRTWHKELLAAKLIRKPIKRLLDIILASCSLILSLPVWLVIIPLIWLEDPGPFLFVKNSVGMGGINFKQLKFRSMISNAEEETGPISGYEHDERVLFIGKLLRKTALDELPQLINIIKGDMSYVGPRPQRTVLVHGYLQKLPEYALRHQVQPGLAGLAQVVDSYDITPEEKLAWDLVYVEKSNLWLDCKLVLSAFFLVFALRWLPNVHPELTIRKLLNIQKPAK